jgi:hypothetical protein
MDDLTPEHFALIMVDIGGVTVEARPYEWDYDGDGNPIVAMAYRTTCPHCSQLIEFNVHDLHDMMFYCNECNKGKDMWTQKNNEMLINKSYDDEPIIFDLIEPIKSGLMEMP